MIVRQPKPNDALGICIAGIVFSGIGHNLSAAIWAAVSLFWMLDYHFATKQAEYYQRLYRKLREATNGT